MSDEGPSFSTDKVTCCEKQLDLSLQVTGIVTYGRGIDPFEIRMEYRVWGREARTHVA